MAQAYKRELESVQDACRRIVASGKLTRIQKARLTELLTERFTNALELVEKHKVHKFRFKPSGRVIWAVEGRKGMYQVIPEVNFCNCDDYYFRVMGGEIGMCYHIVAQNVAAALGKFKSKSLHDPQYAEITEQWRSKLEDGN